MPNRRQTRRVEPIEDMPADHSADSVHRVRQLERDLAEARKKLDEREQLWQMHLKIAARVHRSLLPQPVRHDRIDIDTRYIPVEGIGGDYCQVVFPDAATCYVTICDVTGHGIGASLLATRVSSEVRRMILEARRPVAIVRDLNAFVFESFRDTELQLSFFAVRFRLDTGRITYSGAGHPAPLLIRRDAGSVELLESRNMLIGVAENCLRDEPECSVTLTPGDRILFYSDGVTETRDADGTMLGQERLAAILAGAPPGSVFDLAEAVLEQVHLYRAGPPLDDMTLIVANYKG